MCEHWKNKICVLRAKGHFKGTSSLFYNRYIVCQAGCDRQMDVIVKHKHLKVIIYFPSESIKRYSSPWDIWAANEENNIKTSLVAYR